MKPDFWNARLRSQNPDGASELLVLETEKLLNVRLPAVYLEAMRVQNGGCSSYVDFVQPDSQGQISTEDTYWLAAEYFHTLTELEPLTEPDRDGWDIHVGQLDLLIAFKQSGGCFWCFDYRRCGRQGEPSIVYIDAECEIETQAAPNCAWLFEHLVKQEE